MKEGYTATTGDLMADIIPNCRVHTHQVKLPSGGDKGGGEEWRGLEREGEEEWWKE